MQIRFLCLVVGFFVCLLVCFCHPCIGHVVVSFITSMVMHFFFFYRFVSFNFISVVDSLFLAPHLRKCIVTE